MRGLDDLAHVARDQRPAREDAEVDRLEMAEQRVVALDRHDRLPRLDLVAVEEGVHLQLAPAGHPGAAGVAPAAALAQHRDRLVHATEHGAVPLEHLHDDARVVRLRLERRLREDEVRVRVVAVAHLLDGQVEHIRWETGACRPGGAPQRSRPRGPPPSAARRGRDRRPRAARQRAPRSRRRAGRRSPAARGGSRRAVPRLRSAQANTSTATPIATSDPPRRPSLAARARAGERRAGSPSRSRRRAGPRGACRTARAPWTTSTA